MQIRDIPLEQIVPNPEQPRKSFDRDELLSLADSIKANGLINPITVEQTDRPDLFILEDGERRLRAHRLAGFKSIKAIVKRATSEKADRLSRAFVANLQRADLNPVEEGNSFLRLHNEFKWPMAKIVRVTGFSQALIANRISIAKLQPEIQELIIKKQLPKDQKAIDAFLSIPDIKARAKLAQGLAKRGFVSVAMIVRACKKLVEQLKSSSRIDGAVAPAIEYGVAKARKGISPIWRQLVEREQVPEWPIIKAAAEHACSKCPFFKKPSQSTCGLCPAVDLVANTVKISHEIKIKNK